ncbi:MAG TPA: hypothetical protein GXZ82_03355 [Firmicutes bacterium]|jgi:cell division protein FtsX|nr:hypothetical protein [Bacillota bacterium]
MLKARIAKTLLILTITTLALTLQGCKGDVFSYESAKQVVANAPQDAVHAMYADLTNDGVDEVVAVLRQYDGVMLVIYDVKEDSLHELYRERQTGFRQCDIQVHELSFEQLQGRVLQVTCENTGQDEKQWLQMVL